MHGKILFHSTKNELIIENSKGMIFLIGKLRLREDSSMQFSNRSSKFIRFKRLFELVLKNIAVNIEQRASTLFLI
jgi:hypothetical protein